MQAIYNLHVCIWSRLQFAKCAMKGRSQTERGREEEGAKQRSEKMNDGDEINIWPTFSLIIFIFYLL